MPTIDELTGDVTARSAVVARLKTKRQSERGELLELERRLADSRADGAEQRAETVESMIRAVETRLRRTENALGEAERRLAEAKERLLVEQRRTADDRARAASDEAVRVAVEARDALLALGVTANEVADRLGNSVEIVLSTYTESPPTIQRQAADMLARLVTTQPAEATG